MLKQTLLRGLKVTIPLLLTIVLVVWALQAIEGIFSSVLKPILPFYFPGLGALLGLVLVFMVGLLINAWAVQAIWSWGERGINRIPLIKTIYSSITDLVNLMDQSKNKLGTPVVVDLKGIKLLGFITAEHVAEFGMKDGDVAVYFPMSYQIGGYTVLLPKERVTIIEASTQDTMKFVLTAGVTYAPPEKPRDE